MKAPATAITSSSRATGRSLPTALASRERTSYPPRVPTIAPAAPAPAPSARLPPDAPMAAPENAPDRIRNANEGGAFRLGVLGSLSAISSQTAKPERTYGVAAAPRNDSQVLPRCSHPHRAAQLTIAGAIID